MTPGVWRPRFIPAAVMLSACGTHAAGDGIIPPSAGAGSPGGVHGHGTPATPTQMTGPGFDSSAMRPLIEMARADLARRLGIAPDSVEVVEARAVVWPDASLGCPRPGMAYKQVPEDGALVRLSAGGRVYHYHSGGSRALFLCERPVR